MQNPAPFNAKFDLTNERENILSFHCVDVGDRKSPEFHCHRAFSIRPRGGGQLSAPVAYLSTSRFAWDCGTKNGVLMKMLYFRLLLNDDSFIHGYSNYNILTKAESRIEIADFSGGIFL